jgi:preprotein translocase subunit SecA
MTALNVPEDEPIQAGMISGAIESAQSKIEGFNFDARKHLLDYDDVVNKHREIIYKKRKEFLETPDLKDKILEIFKKSELQEEDYLKKEKELGQENMRQVEKYVCLRVLDMLWQEHLSYIDHIRDSVRLRAYAGRDPLVEYKNEAHKAFGQLLSMLDANIAENILKSGIQPDKSRKHFDGPATMPAKQALGGKEVGRNDPCPCGAKHPDGTPIKYKKCCGK